MTTFDWTCREDKPLATLQCFGNVNIIQQIPLHQVQLTGMIATQIRIYFIWVTNQSVYLIAFVKRSPQHL